MADNDNIDYNTEYAEFRRCRTCNRKTNGVEEYINLKTKKTTKTCIKCRERISKSLKKKLKTKPTKNKLIEIFARFLNEIEPEKYNEIINDPENKNKDFTLLTKYRLEE